jgi:hypothetical protein
MYLCTHYTYLSRFKNYSKCPKRLRRVHLHYHTFVHKILFTIFLDGDVQVDKDKNETQTETESTYFTAPADSNSNKAKETRRLPVATIDEAGAIKYINESFSHNINKVHSFYSCKNKKCTNLNPDEVKRISTKGDRFQHAWITDNKLTYCEKRDIIGLFTRKVRACSVSFAESTILKMKKTSAKSLIFRLESALNVKQ